LVDLLRQLLSAGTAQIPARALDSLLTLLPVRRPGDPGLADSACDLGRPRPARLPSTGRRRHRTVLPGQAVRLLHGGPRSAALPVVQPPRRVRPDGPRADVAARARGHAHDAVRREGSALP